MDTNNFSIQADSFRLVAAGDTLWQGLKPDDYKAYVGFRVCRSLPHIAGPESHGRYFGMHPQVLHNSKDGLLHQQTNLGHALKAYGATRDRIVGTILGVAFPDPRMRVWELPEKASEAPFLEVVAVIHKAAEGVAKLIGNHQSSRQKSAVSIEAEGTDAWIYWAKDRSFRTFKDALEEFPEAITKHEERGWQAGKVDGHQLVFTPGGQAGKVIFQGIGYTPTPADDDAKVTRIHAHGMDGLELAASMVQLDWEPGMEVAWKPIVAGMDAGAGVVVEVITEGEHKVSGLEVKADSLHPILRVKVPGKKGDFLRTSATLKKLKVLD